MNNIDILKQIVRYCNEIDDAAVWFSGTTQAETSIFRNAVSMCMLEIGELTAHLTDEFKTVYNGVPWQEIKGMRNVAAYRHDNVDLEKLCETITEDIPGLRQYCEQTISQHETLIHDAVDLT